MLAGPAGGSIKMGNKRHGDNFTEIKGFFKDGKERIFIVIKFILVIGKKSAKERCFCAIM